MGGVVSRDMMSHIVMRFREIEEVWICAMEGLPVRGLRQGRFVSEDTDEGGRFVTVG